MPFCDKTDTELLLPLHSKLYIWGSPFWWYFCVCDRLGLFFFNPTIKVVTFRLRRWCTLGVFLLPAFTRPGHECQDLLSPCNGMHMCTDGISVYTRIRKNLGGTESETMLTPREKIPSTGGREEVRTRDTASRRTASPTHYRLSYSRPRDTELTWRTRTRR